MIKEEKVVISNDINIGATIAYKDKTEKYENTGLENGNSYGIVT